MATKLPSKNTVYFYIFGALILLVISVIAYVYFKNLKPTTQEHFVEDDYEARLHVMKIFDLVLNRKPTSEEIDKYSKFHNEQDILLQIIKDFKSNDSIVQEESVQEEKKDELNTTETFEESKSNDDISNSFGDITSMLKEKAKKLVKQLDETVKEKYIDDTQNDKICFKKRDVHDMISKLQSELDKIKLMVH